MAKPWGFFSTCIWQCLVANPIRQVFGLFFQGKHGGYITYAGLLCPTLHDAHTPCSQPPPLTQHPPALTLATPTAATGGSASAGVSFNQVLASANGGEALSKHVFRNGRVSVDMHADGKRINNVSYYDESGQKLTTSGFWPQDILRNCEKFSIPLTDFKDVGQQLDAAGVGYRALRTVCRHWLQPRHRL